MGERPRVALALQGGGAFGAYGWGVIDRLLEADCPIVAVSGASAGAMNGAALVSGLVAGGRDGARATLEALWRAVSRRSPLGAWAWSGMGGPFLEPLLRRSLEVAKLSSRYVSPWLPGVRSMQALRAVVRETIDLDLLARQERLPFYVSATDIETGRARLFTGAEVTLDALMASACLPDLFDAVEIEGRSYWDGGYTANPALEPLVFEPARPTDLIVVQLTPFEAPGTGDSLADTVARVNDISFSACLLRDLAVLTELQTIARRDGSRDARLQRIAEINIHLIPASEGLCGRGAGSKSDTRWTAIEALRDLGRATAEAWLAEHGDLIGERSSLTEIAA